MAPKRQRIDDTPSVKHKSLGTYERVVTTRSVSANCKISSVHDFVKVLPNHSLDERMIDDVENEALISTFLADKVDPDHVFTPSLRAIHGGMFQACTAPGGKYEHCNEVIFPTTGIADAIVIISNELDMLGVGEQLREQHGDGGIQEFVREVWKIMRTVVRLSNDHAFMHNDLHANNIVFNRATRSLYMIDFGRSVIDLKGWDRAQSVLDDLEKITGIGSTPTMVRKRVGVETGLHWIPPPSRMPRTCLWAADICMFSMNLLQSHLTTLDEPILHLPFATLTLQQETHSPYSDEAWANPIREIRIRLPSSIGNSEDVLQAATQLVYDNAVTGKEQAIVCVTLVGAAIAAIMMAHKPSHERLFFGESSQIDRAPDLTPAERKSVIALWNLASAHADNWNVGGGGHMHAWQPECMLSSCFPTSMSKAYISKPPAAYGLFEDEMDTTPQIQSTYAPISMVTGHQAPVNVAYSQYPPMPVTVTGGADNRQHTVWWCLALLATTVGMTLL